MKNQFSQNKKLKEKKSKDLDNQIKSVKKIIWSKYGLECEKLVERLVKLKIEKEKSNDKEGFSQPADTYSNICSNCGKTKEEHINYVKGWSYFCSDDENDDKMFIPKSNSHPEERISASNSSSGSDTQTKEEEFNRKTDWENNKDLLIPIKKNSKEELPSRKFKEVIEKAELIGETFGRR